MRSLCTSAASRAREHTLEASRTPRTAHMLMRAQGCEQGGGWGRVCGRNREHAQLFEHRLRELLGPAAEALQRMLLHTFFRRRRGVRGGPGGEDREREHRRRRARVSRACVCATADAAGQLAMGAL